MPILIIAALTIHTIGIFQSKMYDLKFNKMEGRKAAISYSQVYGSS